MLEPLVKVKDVHLNKKTNEGFLIWIMIIVIKETWPNKILGLLKIWFACYSSNPMIKSESYKAWAILVFYCKSTPIIKISSFFLGKCIRLTQKKKARISVIMLKIRSCKFEEQSIAVSFFTLTNLSFSKSLRWSQAKNLLMKPLMLKISIS